MKLGNLLLIPLFFISCSDNETYEPTSQTNPPTENESIIPLVFYDSFTNTSTNYEAVKIGEYLWMNSNINHYESQALTKADVELVFTRYRMNPKALNNVSISDINKYCGPYYDRNRFEYLEDRTKCVIYEGKNKILTKHWGAASTTDFQQLFAMCGNASEQDVRSSLTVKPEENTVAIKGLTYWFQANNTNKFGFNLMPSGARFNGPQSWTLKHNSQGTDDETFEVARGDLYGFMQAAIWQTWDGWVAIHDYPQVFYGKLFHWLPVRWCRKLTDQELGYKLYINQAHTDIKKLGLTESVPSGYSELPNGYIRGFYVQFILDNPNPLMTVPQIVALAKTR